MCCVSVGLLSCDTLLGSVSPMGCLFEMVVGDFFFSYPRQSQLRCLWLPNLCLSAEAPLKTAHWAVFFTLRTLKIEQR